jgi:hypothetical protein
MIDIKGDWLYLYVVVLLVLLVSMIISIVGNRTKFHIEGGINKKVGMVIAGILGFSVLTAFSVFSGMPTVLHHLNASDGKLEVTVSGKEDLYDKRECNPRLIIEEFTYFSSDFICPGDEAYKSISVGDKVTVIGAVSEYGVESKQIQWLTKTGLHAASARNLRRR